MADRTLAYPLQGLRVLVTGASGLVGFPLCRALAERNEVIATARFRIGDDAAELEKLGTTPIACDITSRDLSLLPGDVDVVFHLAAKTAVGDDSPPAERQRQMLEANAYATGRLISKYRDAKAFVYASSCGVYADQGRRLGEGDPYGILAGLEDYSLSKIAAETLVRFLGEEWGLPVTILRLFSMFGPRGGTSTGRIDDVRSGVAVGTRLGVDNEWTMMYEDDYVEKIARAATVASVPPLVVNLGGLTITIEEFCNKVAAAVGTEARFAPKENGVAPRAGELSLMSDLLGEPSVTVDEAIRRVLAADRSERSAAWSDFRLPGEAIHDHQT